MDKRYQVFVSSTYKDLIEERREVMQALLELDHIPAGMELFPASDDDSWTLIKRVIDESDYYIVIVGGRYGSTGPDGIGYTEMEYRYALETDVPIIAFLHEKPEDLPQKKGAADTKEKEALDDFRELCSQKNCKFWSSPSDLGSKVSRSLIQLVKRKAGIGWIRADQVEENAQNEILRLRAELAELKKTQAEEGLKLTKKNFACGQQTFKYGYNFVWIRRDSNLKYYKSQQKKSFKDDTEWDEVFRWMGPSMMDEASSAVIKSRLDAFITRRKLNAAMQAVEWNDEWDSGQKIVTHRTTYEQIIVQFKALGYIKKSDRNRSVNDKMAYFSLTELGEDTLTSLLAIPSSKAEGAEQDPAKDFDSSAENDRA